MFRLSEHVRIIPYDPVTDRPNIAVIGDGPDCVLFDVGCGPKTIAMLKRELGDLPKRAIISHFHWDHCFASGYYEGMMVGSDYTNEKLRQMLALKATSIDSYINQEHFMPEFCREHMHMEYSDVSEIRLRALDEAFSGFKTISAGDVHIELLEIVSPHCEGQIVAYVVEDKVLLLGDSNSASIVGLEFVDDPVKRKVMYGMLDRFDYKTVVTSHFDPMGRAEYLANR